MTERVVRFTDQFFTRLEALLPPERGSDGTPSSTDFLLMEVPTVRDRLARDFTGSTLPTDDPDVRVHICAGTLFPAIAFFTALDVDGRVEVFWLAIDR